MRTLLWKELRDLKMFVALVAGVELLALGFSLATKCPDQQVFNPADAMTTGHDILFFGIMLAAGLLIRESDEGTLNFLDGLPVSRTRIFAAKMIAGFLVLAIVPVLEFLPDVIFGLLSQTSISPPFPWRFCVVYFGLSLVCVVNILTVFTALSFLRKWFAMTLGLLCLAYLWLQARHLEWVRIFNPETLQPRGDAAAAQIPYRDLAWHCGISAAALFLGWLGFQAIGARSRDWTDRAGTAMRVFLFAGRIGTPIICIGAFIALMATSPQPPAEGFDLANEKAFAKQETERYEFLFRESQRSTAAPLLGTADPICDTVTDFFHTAKNSDRIVVDLASPLISHALGMTNWSKIRVSLTPGETEGEFRSVLGHETAHVVMNRLGGTNFISEFNSTRFFNEGMATVVQERFFDSPDALKASRKLAAAVASRGKVAFEVLCDNEALSKSRDAEVVYPMGSAFGRALIHVCGPASPTRVLTEFNRLRAGNTAHGAALWREIFQSCGYSLDTVIAQYDAELDSVLKQEAEFVKGLPRLTASLEKGANGEILLRPHYEGTAPGRIVFGVDHSSEMLGPDIRWHSPGKNGAAAIPRDEAADSKVRYMVGWIVKDLNWPVFEPWAEVAVPQ